jgi:excisionase family DNA binding protein
MTKPSSVPPILINATEAARLLSISERKLWQLTKDGDVPSVRIDKCVRYRIADLEEWTRRPQLGLVAPTCEVRRGEH